MWNCKTLKIQRTFQNWSRFLELQNSFAIHKWGKMYNVLRNVVFYHTRKLLNVKKIKMVMIWSYYHFKRQNTKFTRN
jgi:hypothetical protein